MALSNEDALRIEQAACRQNLSYFIERAFKIVTPGTVYHHNWHIDALSEALTACYKRDIKRLIINVPPRSLKSVSVSSAFPAWALGQDPTLKFMCASYSEKLAFEHSMDTRRIISDEWFASTFPNTRLSEDQNEKSKFSTTQQGYRIATSVGGRATGFGANFLLTDDAHSPEEALSQAIRESHLRWFDLTWSSRLNDKEKDVMIVVMQRLHQMDLCGHLLAQGGWEHLLLPAIFDKPKTISIGRFRRDVKAGELLHPRRFPKEFLDREKGKSAFGFSSQYMQEPVPEGGGIVKNDWLKLWPAGKPLPKFHYIIQSWDTAFTENTSGDPSACVTLGVFFPEREDREEVRELGQTFAVMIIDCFSEHLNFPNLRSKMIEMRHYMYGEQEKKVDLILVEKKGSGQSIIQELRNANLPVKDANPGRLDKVARLHAVTHFIENGFVYIPESKNRLGQPVSWILDLINQLCSFPAAQHDDYVDCVTQGLSLLSSMDFLRADGMADDVDDDDSDPHANVHAANPYGS